MIFVMAIACTILCSWFIIQGKLYGLDREFWFLLTGGTVVTAFWWWRAICEVLQ